MAEGVCVRAAFGFWVEVDKGMVVVPLRAELRRRAPLLLPRRLRIQKYVARKVSRARPMATPMTIPAMAPLESELPEDDFDTDVDVDCEFAAPGWVDAAVLEATLVDAVSIMSPVCVVPCPAALLSSALIFDWAAASREPLFVVAAYWILADVVVGPAVVMPGATAPDASPEGEAVVGMPSGPRVTPAAVVLLSVPAVLPSSVDC